MSLLKNEFHEKPYDDMSSTSFQHKTALYMESARLNF